MGATAALALWTIGVGFAHGTAIPALRGPSGQPGQPSVSRVTENEYWSGLVNTVGADAAEWAIWLKHLLFL